jgi:hypothetical protein
MLGRYSVEAWPGPCPRRYTIAPRLREAQRRPLVRFRPLASILAALVGETRIGCGLARRGKGPARPHQVVVGAATRRSSLILTGTAKTRYRRRPNPDAEWSRPCCRRRCNAHAAAARRSTCRAAPHRMTATAHASGAWCWQRSQFSHSHGVARCRSPSVVVARNVFMAGIRRPPGASSPAATCCGEC